MPFLRFSRDKRGYEHTYLVQTTNRRGKSVRPRILYWYRTPPGVRVGRQPFDESVRKVLETQNPGVVFDWAAIAETPFPAPEVVEPWRERRRAERAARQARREEEERDPTVEGAVAAGVEISDSDAISSLPTAGVSSEPDGQEQGPVAVPVGATSSPRRKRRRRGGRRLHGAAEAPSGGDSAHSSTGAPAPSESAGEPSEDQD